MTSPLAWLQLGGPVMAVLAIMSVAVVTLSIIKLWEFSEQRLSSREFVDRSLQAWEGGQGDQALVALADSPSPLAAVLRDAIRILQDARLSPGHARERIERLGVEALQKARTHLRTLDLIGGLAPLVGLLGTVLGMIEAFQALQAAGDRVEPSILSGGIWQALLTTAVGLGIAIPTVALASYFERRVEALQQAMESALTRLLTLPRVTG
ncbi:MotA/TolQ/ExbB proton channel family protein [Panacagrimonas sp.]|uniref:MotA/TolQ/ExbB proton channel family protein n=1 Tax=Panacagrimonas sp. TaxID=2480088 RepID=UPI003B524831